MIFVCLIIFAILFVLFLYFFFKASQTQISENCTLEKNRLYYIHIPKTGGTFVENFLRQSNVLIGRFENEMINSSVANPDFSFTPDCSHYHVPPKFYSIDFSTVTPFTIIRHPVARLVSDYNWTKRYGKISQDINEFVKQNLTKGNTTSDCHFLPQVDYIVDKNGKECQTFLRFENLDHDLRWLCRTQNIKVHNKKVFKNKTNSKRGELSEESKQHILRFYHDDLHLWKRASTNVIYLYWGTGIENATELSKLCVHSWKALNPTWVIVELNDLNLEEHVSDMTFLKRMKSKMSLTSYSDLVRLSLLLENGGVWADSTVFCLKPLNEWLHDSCPNGFFAFHHPSRKISSWFLYAHRDSVIIQKWYDAMVQYWSDGSQTLGYFWVHKLFQQCFSTEDDFRKNLQNMKWIDTIPLHSFQKSGMIDEATFVQKLSNKKDLNLFPFYEFLFKKKKLKSKFEIPPIHQTKKK